MQKYLGVDLSSDLDWSHHINSITTKANTTLGLLRHKLKPCSLHIKDIGDKTTVRPQLEYCSAIWDPYVKGDILSLDMRKCNGERHVLLPVTTRGSQA